MEVTTRHTVFKWLPGLILAMNIFKILASGDGTINEPSVSAFLGYLLNPKADHGIHDQLLKRVLYALYQKNPESSLAAFLIDRYGECRNLSSHSNFDLEVLLEQAFTDNETERKQIVDIVILCYEKILKRSESLARITLSNQGRGELRHIFLIENKIRDGSLRENQIFDQYIATSNTLSKILAITEQELSRLMSVIFVSPYSEKSIAEFARLEERADIPKLHIFWDVEEETENISSITQFLHDILSEESNGQIDSIGEYSKSTIKSFIQFVRNDFKSAIQEELEAETIQDIGYDFAEFQTKYRGFLDEQAWKVADYFQAEVRKQYNDVIVRHSRTHPVAVLLKNKQGTATKILSLTRKGKRLVINLVYRRENAIDAKTLSDTLSEYIKSFEKVVPKAEDMIQINDSMLTGERAIKCFHQQYQFLKER